MESWHSPPNRQRRSTSKKARLVWKKLGIFFYTSTSRIICCRPLCITPVQLLCKVIGDWPLRAAGRIGTCTTLTCSERLLVGEKAKPLIFARKRKRCFSKVEHTWNWNVRMTKAALRHRKRENWNIFQKIWKKSNTPQESVLDYSSNSFLEEVSVFPFVPLVPSEHLVRGRKNLIFASWQTLPPTQWFAVFSYIRSDVKESTKTEWPAKKLGHQGLSPLSSVSHLSSSLAIQTIPNGACVNTS